MTFREEYVTVTATLKARTDKAALLHLDGGDGAGGWVPRRCMHFLTDKAIQNAVIGDEIEGRIMEWVADEKGLI